MTAVFLSFTIADQAAAADVERVLRSHGIEVLTGMTVPAGASLSKAVLDEMENADAFVFLISKQFVKSQWTQIEVAAAMAQVTSGSGKRLIPLLVSPDVDPNEDVPPLLQRFSWLDLREEFNEQSLAPLVAVLTSSEPPPAIEDQLAAEREMLALRWGVQNSDLARLRVEEEERYLRQSLRQTRRAFYVAMLSALLTGVAVAAGVAVAFINDGPGDGGPFGHTVVVASAVALGLLNVVMATVFSLRTRRSEQMWKGRTGAAREQGQLE